jgi:hypothetical protein
MIIKFVDSKRDKSILKGSKFHVVFPPLRPCRPNCSSQKQSRMLTQSHIRAVLLLLISIVQTSLSSTSTNVPLSNNPYYYQPPSKQHFASTDIISLLQNKWSTAQSLALQEQSVEDHNAEYVATSNSIDSVCYRRCIAMPLDERFDPPVGVFSHGHIETGDKMSLPKCFWEAITRSKAEVSL